MFLTGGRKEGEGKDELSGEWRETNTERYPLADADKQASTNPHPVRFLRHVRRGHYWRFEVLLESPRLHNVF